MALTSYRKKRRFEQTPEPAGRAEKNASSAPDVAPVFVVQRHAARRLHYDLRLEVDGVLRSWAVPKGPSLNPNEKRLAVETEDHPLEYGNFEGVIPEGNYGAGTVQIWDHGTYEGARDAQEQLARGELKFTLRGKRLRGSFVLVRTKPSPSGPKPRQPEWLLIKHRDAAADSGWDAGDHVESAVSGRTLDEIRDGVPPLAPGSASPAAALEGAFEAPSPRPARPEPMLAVIVDKPFAAPDWIFELKWDGIRALADIRGDEVRFFSRAGRDVSAHYPELAILPERLRAGEALLDGEIVVLDEGGRADFGRLQSRMNRGKPSPGDLESAPVVYYVFDVLEVDGYDLRSVALLERKKLLRELLDPEGPIRYSDHIAEKGPELFALAAEKGVEGVVGKQIDSPYVSGRDANWVKIKVRRELDAAVCGFTEPGGGREHFGALLLGLYNGSEFEFVGGVGSGFDAAAGKRISTMLAEQIRKTCPFAEVPKIRQAATWVEPELVARVKFHEWTRETRLRQPVFLGLRDDIDARECRRETKSPVVKNVAAGAAAVTSPAELEKELRRGKKETVTVELDGKRFRLTHLDKIYFPGPGYTKRQVLAYYFEAAPFLLPFLKNRPLVLHRYPNGSEGESFYQKDAGAEKPAWMRTLPIPSQERGKDIHYYVADDLSSLLFLTNLGCIEHHPWSSLAERLEQPDYFFFDLDPVEGTPFSTVVEVAREILKMLERLEMTAFLKTSGATGFHLYLPLKPVYSYEQTRTFAEIVARVIASRMEDRVTLERKVDKRGAGKVYIDYSQNAMGRPLASVYSVRPFPDATVSAPVKVKELRKTLTPARFTIKTMPARFNKQGDLWKEFFESRQTMEAALEKLRRETRAG